MGNARKTEGHVPTDTSLPGTNPEQLAQDMSACTGRRDESTTLTNELASRSPAGVPQHLNPYRVRRNLWSARAQVAYEDSSFEALKCAIADSGGNEEAVVVTKSGDFYKVTQGHRRHQACFELGLPIKAIVEASEPVEAVTIQSVALAYLHQVPISDYEIGTLLARSLDAGVFPSQRRLAQWIGMSHQLLMELILIARLPHAVIRAFPDPRQIRRSHARRLRSALESDPDRVLDAAKLVSGGSMGRCSAATVVQLLCSKTCIARVSGKRGARQAGRTICRTSRERKKTLAPE